MKWKVSTSNRSGSSNGVSISKFLVMPLISLIILLLFLTNEYYIGRYDGTTYNPRRCIQYENGDFQTVGESYKLLLKFLGFRFFDITDVGNKGNDRLFSSQVTLDKRNNVNNLVVFPNQVTRKKELLDRFKKIDQQFLKSKVIDISKFYTRYYNSELGLQFSEWFYDDMITNLINEGEIIDDNKDKISSKLNDKIRVEKFHHSWKQFSVIITILGNSKKEIKDTIVLGSHIDSTNLLFPTLLSARGADDDASGVSVSLMTLKILIDSIRNENFQGFENDVQFHFYSGEEGGFLGSQEIFKYLIFGSDKQNINLRSMVQLDQIGFSDTNMRTQKLGRKNARPLIGIITDHTDPKLTDFVELLIREYCYNGDVNENAEFFIKSECGYACSDNAAAQKFGVPSSLLTESNYKEINKFVHSSWDTIDRLDFDFMEEFAKVSLAYIFELGDYNW